MENNNSYVNKEVKTLNELYKDGKNGDHQKFQSELQKIVKENPGQLKDIAMQMKKTDSADSSLPKIDLLLSKGKVKQIDFDTSGR